MEMVYFTLAAIALYLFSDWIVNLIERRRGERLQNRSILFFAIILVLSLVTFNAIQYLTGDETSDDGEASGPSASQQGSPKQ